MIDPPASTSISAAARSSKRVIDFTGGITDDIAGRFKQDPVMLGWS